MARVGVFPICRGYCLNFQQAVYARADLVLLDDCLAAVDSHVARHVFDQVIGPNGLLAGQARILVTNSIAFVKQFDQVAFISRGIIRECGSFQTLMENSDGDLSKLVCVPSLYCYALN